MTPGRDRDKPSDNYQLTDRDRAEIRIDGRLTLANRHLTRVPDEVFEITQLSALDLSGNSLTELPSDISKLAHLNELNVSRNQLTSLPRALGELSHLHTLNLSANRLTDLPDTLKKLRELWTLLFTGNQLETLPDVITRIPRLQVLWLNENRLTGLPADIDRLVHLKQLRLVNNQLETLPPAIGRLGSLVTLRLEGNKLPQLPPEVGYLATLHILQLDDNILTELPPEIGRLTDLRTLSVTRNQLSALPAEIGELTKLQQLRANGNQLTTLPVELAGIMSDNFFLDLRDNPLAEPLPGRVQRGLKDLRAYLGSLKNAAEQYEAKILLLGEGDVGKTSLAAALRDQPFEERRPATPGIEISTLSLPHPFDSGIAMALRLWDFGGQEDYRITHQLFISQRALYLVVWYPRQGWRASDVETWLRGIMLRTGHSQADAGVRVMIVATHSDTSRATVDYPRLERQFRGILAGHFEIDSRSGNGLDRLTAAIRREAAGLPQMGTPIGAEWAAARQAVLERAETEAYITFADFADICRRSHVPEDGIQVLAGMMHDLGQIVYYGDDETLRGIVVLRPQWLTEAISHVLNDLETREAGGLLDHRRLAEIWRDRPGSPGYPREQYAFFLQLMEKFDVSYRVEGELKSLIAQLVPHERPDLPWDFSSPAGDGTRKLALRCRLSAPAPGLIAWLTVRLHRSSTGLHWRDGVFIRYWQDINSEALIELDSEQALAVEVRAPSPDYLFSILTDAIRYLLDQRWPGLSYNLVVPCPTREEDGSPCADEFPLEFLRNCRERGVATATCHTCIREHDVNLLLTGFPRKRPVSNDLQLLEHIATTVDRTALGMTSVLNSLRSLLMAADSEVNDCPHLFTLRPEPAGPAEFFRRHYRLMLWCEYPNDAHPADGAGYALGEPREWFRRIRPYAAVMVQILKVVLPIAGAVGPEVMRFAHSDQVRLDFEAMNSLLETVKPLVTDEDEEDLDSLGNDPGGDALLTRAQGAGLRALRQLILSHDAAQKFCGLEKVRSPVTGDYLWLCPEHRREYDRGLPAIEPGEEVSDS